MTNPRPPKSMAHAVWRDLTPIGRWTIGVPLVVMVYATMALLIPVAVMLFILVKIGLIQLVEKSIAGVKSLVFWSNK